MWALLDMIFDMIRGIMRTSEWISETERSQKRASFQYKLPKKKSSRYFEEQRRWQEQFVTDSFNEQELGQDQRITTPRKKQKLRQEKPVSRSYIEQHPIKTSFWVGFSISLLIQILPVFYIAYPDMEGFSNVAMCLFQYSFVGGLLAIVGGLTGKGVGKILDQHTSIRKSQFIGSLVGVSLAAIIGLFIGGISLILFIGAL